MKPHKMKCLIHYGARLVTCIWFVMSWHLSSPRIALHLIMYVIGHRLPTLVHFPSLLFFKAFSITCTQSCGSSLTGDFWPHWSFFLPLRHKVPHSNYASSLLSAAFQYWMFFGSFSMSCNVTSQAVNITIYQLKRSRRMTKFLENLCLWKHVHTGSTNYLS